MWGIPLSVENPDHRKLAKQSKCHETKYWPYVINQINQTKPRKARKSENL